MRRALLWTLTAVAALATLSCVASPITSSRIEEALERTFANLVDTQLSRLGLPPMPAPDFAVTAICRRQTAGRETGSGEWTCTLVWQNPERRTVRDAYDLFVTTDGCYTATAAGETLGGPALQARDGRVVRNLLRVFEGCFNVN